MRVKKGSKKGSVTAGVMFGVMSNLVADTYCCCELSILQVRASNLNDLMVVFRSLGSILCLFHGPYVAPSRLFLF